MRKYFLTVWGCALLSVCSFAQFTKNPINESFKGKVQLIEETTTLYDKGFPKWYDSYDEDWEGWDEIERVYEDEEGSLTQYNQYEEVKSVRICTEQRPFYRKYMTYDAEKELTGQLIIEWDEKNIKMTEFDEYDTEITVTTAQRENGAITELQLQELHERPIVVRRINNEHGDCIEEIQQLEHFDNDTEEPPTLIAHYISTYEYDTTGNWIKQTKTYQGKKHPCEMVERKISYY